MMADGYQYMNAMKLAAPRVRDCSPAPAATAAPGAWRPRTGWGRPAGVCHRRPCMAGPTFARAAGVRPRGPARCCGVRAAARWAPAPRRQSMRLRIWGRQARPRCPSAGRAAGFQVGVDDDAR